MLIRDLACLQEIDNADVIWGGHLISGGIKVPRPIRPPSPTNPNPYYPPEI